MRDIQTLFTSFLEQKIFKNREALTDRFTPDQIYHRDGEIERIATTLGPGLRGEKPQNIFIYGRTGTGKTLVTRYVTSNFEKIARVNGRNVKVVYLNCKLNSSNTEYRVFASILRELGVEVPSTGLPTEEIYRRMIDKFEEISGLVVIVLDEFDALVRRIGDEILYKFTRMDTYLKNSIISIICITNDLTLIRTLDPRIKSSLCAEEILFPPYNKEQLKDILSQRVRIAFKDGVVSESVIDLCAAIAAQEHGDARRALNLLRVAGEIAEREGAERVTEEHVHRAYEKMERDAYIDLAKNMPFHEALLLFVIFQRFLNGEKEIRTGEAYSLYRSLCQKLNVKSVTERRVSDYITELAVNGIISCEVVSQGRGGRTRIITPKLSLDIMRKVVNVLGDKFL
jgi:cell division control protein 6